MDDKAPHWNAHDGTPLAYNAVFPECTSDALRAGLPQPSTLHGSSPNALVLIVHGMSEHKGRHRLLQQDLARAGFASYAMDQRGFGESGGPRTHVDTFHHYLDDLALIQETLQKKHPGLPFFLLGHSMGALVALCFAIRDRPPINGLIVSAPVVFHIRPPFRLRILAHLLTFLQPRRYFAYENNLQWFSHNPRVIEEFVKDPLCQNTGTPRFYTELQGMRRYLLREAPKLLLPLLILQGAGDRIVFPEGAQRLHDLVASRDKHLIYYEGFYHESFNEIGRERVVEDTVKWVNERIN